MVAVFQHSLLVTIYNQFPTQTSVIQITNETAQYQHYISVSQIRSMDADTALCASQSRPSSFQPCIHSAFFTDHKPTHACVYAIHIQEHHSAQSSSLSSSTALSWDELESSSIPSSSTFGVCFLRVPLATFSKNKGQRPQINEAENLSHNTLRVFDLY